MRISVATDSLDGVAEHVVKLLRTRGHEVVTHGALNPGNATTGPGRPNSPRAT